MTLLQALAEMYNSKTMQNHSADRKTLPLERSDALKESEDKTPRPLECDSVHKACPSVKDGHHQQKEVEDLASR